MYPRSTWRTTIFPIPLGAQKLGSYHSIHVSSAFLQNSVTQARIPRAHLLQLHASIFRLNAHQSNLIATRLIGHYHSNFAVRVIGLSFTGPTKSAFVSDSFVCNGLLMVYAKVVRDLSSARQVFDDMPDRNLVFCWTCLISGSAKLGSSEVALNIFTMMLDENLLIPWVNFDQISDKGKRSILSWNTMIGTYVQNGCALEALTVFKSIRCILSACAEIRDLDLGIWVHNYMRTSGKKHVLSSSNVNLAYALIDMYSKCGNLDAAREVFAENFPRCLICV
ncbi:hypothetical protein MIMGU_mgv1a018468mg, partial [Erythranthe guttata]